GEGGFRFRPVCSGGGSDCWRNRRRCSRAGCIRRGRNSRGNLLLSWVRRSGRRGRDCAFGGRCDGGIGFVRPVGTGGRRFHWRYADGPRLGNRCGGDSRRYGGGRDRRSGGWGSLLGGSGRWWGLRTAGGPVVSRRGWVGGGADRGV